MADVHMVLVGEIACETMDFIINITKLCDFALHTLVFSAHTTLLQFVTIKTTKILCGKVFGGIHKILSLQKFQPIRYSLRLRFFGSSYTLQLSDHRTS